MGFGFEHGHYYNMVCIDCEHNKLPDVCYGFCDHDCCCKCESAELHMRIRKDPDTYDCGLYCVWGYAYPGRSCEHYCDITKEDV